MNEIWKELRRVRFKIPCFLFEMQVPGFIWSNIILGIIAYHLHDFLCSEMWMIRFFPRYLEDKIVVSQEWEE